MNPMLRAAFAAVLALAATPLAACASDARPEPEPQLEDPGSFVAVRLKATQDGGAPATSDLDGGATAPPGTLTLQRTLDRVILETGTILVFTVYDVHPASWEAAREASMAHDIPIAQLTAAISEELFIAQSDYQVVWYRTLTDEEARHLQ